MTVGIKMLDPDAGTTWGEPAALSVTVTLPVKVPMEIGENTACIVQFSPGPSDAGQVFVWVKGAPEATIEAIFSGAKPVLDSCKLIIP
jgi:hypothetical protein